MNESDTPLTDAAAFAPVFGADTGFNQPERTLVKADFARTLERRCKVLEEELNDFFAKNSETHSGRAQILERRCKRLEEALRGMVYRYTKLVNSGDSGSWDPEEEPQVIAARAALADQKEEKV